MNIIGERIETILDFHEMNRKNLSEAIGVPYTTLTQIINGRTKNPQIHALTEIANYFGVSLDYLQGRDPNFVFPNRISFVLHYMNKTLCGRMPADEILNHMQLHNPQDYKKFLSLPKDTKVEVDHFKPKTNTHKELEFTAKEERDIAADLERMINDLESEEALAFQGEPMDEETKELMKISLENSLRLAKQMAKQKFNPNKNK